MFSEKPKFTTGDVKAKERVWEHVGRIYDKMTAEEKKRTTHAVAEVETADGKQETWVASAGKENRVRKGLREDGDRVIKATHREGNSENRLNDAKQKLMRQADEEGATIKALGATRHMCDRCQEAVETRGLTDIIVTPLRQ